MASSESDPSDTEFPGPLCDRICHYLKPSRFHNETERAYLPEGNIKDLITENNVSKELDEFKEDEGFNSLVQFILERASKVFAITCLVLEDAKIYKAMKKFQTKHFDDQKLPVAFEKYDEDPNTIKNAKKYRFESDSEAFEDKRLWTSKRSIEFHDKQRMFLVPLFRGNDFMYYIDENFILPFEQDGRTFKEGTFGDVYKVNIHPGHVDELFLQLNDGREYVAVKEITSIRSSQEDATKAFNIEATALSKCRHIKHENMLPCLAAIEKGSAYYFLFPWADGGNLRDFWKNRPEPELTPNFVWAILQQFYGLSDALEKLHGYSDKRDSSSTNLDASSRSEDSGGIRHGDLKPENILIFNSSEDSGIGTLKMADMGLAKHHDVNTRLRKNVTDTKYGTRRYEPPEVQAPELKDHPTSRLYDTWSMGCIILELIVWLMEGQQGLTAFNSSVREGMIHDSEPPYYKVVEGKAEVHPQVAKRLENLAQDANCKVGQTALGDLLEVVRDKLLVVCLPSSSTKDDSPHRATAKVLRESIGKILEKAKNDSGYLIEGDTQRTSRGKTSNLQSDNIQHLNSSTQMKDSAHLDIKVWKFGVDNEFATDFLESVVTSSTTTDQLKALGETKICNSCKSFNFWEPQFKILDNIVRLKRDKQDCSFCEMKWNACKHLEGVADQVSFERIGSVIKLNESDPPVFSIFKSKNAANADHIPIGRPIIPKSPRDESQFQLIKKWLENCNTKHHACKPELDQCENSSLIGCGKINETNFEFARNVQSQRSVRLPTRLLDLGTGPVPVIRLYETTKQDDPQDFNYIALSHPWGDPTPSKPHFRTTKNNRADHLIKIELKDLPNTFKDAVITTRAIGVRYLWIDSICIIQGPDGDFNTESQRMEQVFSSAYCVIAASCATGQWDGFLRDRAESCRNRHVVFEHSQGSSFYVGNFLDDFTSDVIEGSLNRRGWVLQERALARRTIYFTEKQTYWECGDGVRCETLSKMNNQLAAFLGDPNFPGVAIRSSKSRQATSRGQRILYYQDLYKAYSRLQFTQWEDRAVAMGGLEQRLRWGFKCRGKFGILDDSSQAEHRSLFHRSLLWHRAVEEGSLERIVFPPNREKAPTWSWMAFRGAIDYLRVPFNEFEWAAELKSPWQAPDTRSASRTEVPGIRATGQRLILGNCHRGDAELVFNSRGQSQPRASDPLCVVVGKAKSFKSAESRTHYILIVRPTGLINENQVVVCERIGAGRVPGSCIGAETSCSDLRIR